MYTITRSGARPLDDHELRSVKDSVNGWKQAELDALGFGVPSPLEQPQDDGLLPERDEDPLPTGLATGP